MGKRSIHLAYCAVAFLLVARVSPAPAQEAPLPYIDGFESNSLGSAWAVSGEGEVAISNVTSAAGLRSCSVNDSEMSLSVADSELGSNVWVRVYLKPVPYDDSEGPPALPTNHVAGFYINSTGSLWVLHGTGYVRSVAPALPTNTWLGFAMHLDYGRQQWELYKTGDPYGAPLEKADSFVYNFCSGVVHRSNLSRLTVRSVSKGYVDAVAMATARINPDFELWSNVMAIDLPGRQAFMMAPPPYDYSGVGTLGGQLGYDLTNGLVTGDFIYFLASNGWKSAELDTVPSWQGDTGAIIAHGQSFWVSRIANSADSAVFYPFADRPANASQTIYGTNNTDKMGWNNLVWPTALNTRGQAEGNGWHFDSAANNDKLWVYNSGMYTVLKYISASSHWSRVGQRIASDLKLVPGQAFWYQRSVGSDYTWDPAD